MPFTHVENCADCFRAAVEAAPELAESLNVVDGHELTLRNLGHVADVLYRYPQASERLLVAFFATGAVVADFPAEAPDL